MAEFTWSYSSLKQYQNCPKQYHEIRVLKNYTVKETEAIIYGKAVHEALELYVKENKPLAKKNPFARIDKTITEINNKTNLIIVIFRTKV